MQTPSAKPDPGRVTDALRVDFTALAAFAPHAWPFQVVMDNGPTALLDQLHPSLAQKRRYDAARLLEQANATGTRAIVPGDGEWPGRIEALNHDGGSIGAPLCLWARGPQNLPAISSRSILLTGSRAATEYGQQVAQALANDLADIRHATVIANTGRFGIDAAALNGALTAYERTPPLVILATGMDGSHPHQHHDLFRHIAETGLVLSANPPCTLPTRPTRQYASDLLAALTAATVIVEAANPRSSYLASARRAAAMGRPVFATPGPVTSVHSNGCHQLIRDGIAELATSAKDITPHLPGANA